MIDRSEHLNELATALAKAQAQIATAKRDSANPFFKSSYADLASVWEACRDALTSNGLSVVQLPGFSDGMATLDTMLLHSSGQWLQATAGAPLGKQDAQGVGSVITYLRRYALAAVASVSPADDDGNEASGRGGKSPAVSKGAAATRTRAVSAPPSEPLTERPAAIVAGEAEKMPWDGKPEPLKWKNKLLTDFKSDELTVLRDFCEKKDATAETPKYGAYLTGIEEILESRRGE
jgi:hypothetical protein